MVFGGEARFIDAFVHGSAEFDGAQFESIAVFERITTGKSVYFRTGADERRTAFKGDANFMDAKVHGSVEFDGSMFFGLAGFAGLVEGALLSRPDKSGSPVVFGKGAQFLGASVGAQAEFSGSVFEGDANFDGAKFRGLALFRLSEQGLRTVFKGLAKFRGSWVGDNMEFDGAEFLGGANFEDVHVGGSAYFRAAKTPSSRIPIRFGKVAQFGGAEFANSADFSGAVFDGDASFGWVRARGPLSFGGVQFGGFVMFEGARLKGGALFVADDLGSAPVFGGGASFASATFGVDAKFREVLFEKPARFRNAHFRGFADFTSAKFAPDASATWNGARFELAAPLDKALFEGTADFTGAVADGDALFQGAVFAGRSTFREARFRVVRFAEGLTGVCRDDGSRQFRGRVDLRGFTYERIYVNWLELFGRMEEYDRQPFTQMQRAVRATGDDRTADEIYLCQQKREHEEKRGLYRVGGWLWGTVCNYGVRPWRLAGLAAAVLALSTVAFMFPHAVVGGRVPKIGSGQHRLSWAQALGMSIHQFLPITIPSGGWQPMPGFFAAWASVEHVFGWILVPLGVAALVGLLRRGGSTRADDL